MHSTGDSASWSKYLTSEGDQNGAGSIWEKVDAPKYVDFLNLEQAEAGIDQFFSTRLESPDVSVVSKSRKSLSGLQKRKVDPATAETVLQLLESDAPAPAPKQSLGVAAPSAVSAVKAARSESVPPAVDRQNLQPIYPLRSTAALTIPLEFKFNTTKRKREPVAPTSQAAALMPRQPPPQRPKQFVTATRAQPPRDAKAAAIPKVSQFAASTASRGSARRSPVFARLSKPKVAPPPRVAAAPVLPKQALAAPGRPRLTVPHSPKFSSANRSRSVSRSFLAPKPTIAKKETVDAATKYGLKKRALAATAGEMGISLVSKKSLTVPTEVNMSTSSRAGARASMSMAANNSVNASTAPGTAGKKRSLGGALPSAANSSILASALKPPGTAPRPLTVPRSPTLSTKKRALNKVESVEALASAPGSVAKPTPSRSSIRATPASGMKKSAMRLTEPKPFNFTVDKRSSAAADKFKLDMAEEMEKEAASFAAFRPSPYSAKKRKSIVDAPKSSQKKQPLSEVHVQNAVNAVMNSQANIQQAAAKPAVVEKPVAVPAVEKPADELAGFQLHTDSRFLQMTQAKNKEFEQYFTANVPDHESSASSSAAPRSTRHSPRLAAAALRGL